mmetsp:Transcript_2904/g.8875  ORF Transcript_2904/g.8875 Transcript_2904/m.8875 type:complete len:266 (-) Transcript_2904:197-994(-)
MLQLQSLIVEGHDQLGHIVHGDHLLGSNVQRLSEIRVHEANDTLDGIVNVAERSCLLTIAPHLKFLVGGNTLTAEGSWGLLASALPGSVRAVDVVESADSREHLEVLGVVNGELLGRKLLKSVRILGLRRPGIRLLESRVLRIELGSLRIDTCRGSIVESSHITKAGSFKHVEGNKSVVVHNHRVVRLDEAHSAHIGSQVVHISAAFHGILAVLHLSKIDQHELVAEVLFLHVLILLPVSGDDLIAQLLELLCKVRSDETACSSD